MVNKEDLNTKEFFYDKMVGYMNTEYKVSKLDAKELVDKHKDNILVDEPMVQFLGYDYFSIQILMEEGVIPLQPI